MIMAKQEFTIHRHNRAVDPVESQIGRELMSRMAKKRTLAWLAT
jgi:hypothetical protein